MKCFSECKPNGMVMVEYIDKYDANRLRENRTPGYASAKCIGGARAQFGHFELLCGRYTGHFGFLWLFIND